jgi:hypothetical protein
MIIGHIYVPYIFQKQPSFTGIGLIRADILFYNLTYKCFMIACIKEIIFRGL